MFEVAFLIDKQYSCIEKGKSILLPQMCVYGELFLSVKYIVVTDGSVVKYITVYIQDGKDGRIVILLHMQDGKHGSVVSTVYYSMQDGKISV